MTAPTAPPPPVHTFEAVQAPSELAAPDAGLVTAMGARPIPAGLAGGVWMPDKLGEHQVIDPCALDPAEFPAETGARKLRLIRPLSFRTRYWWQGRPQDFDDQAAARYASAMTSAVVAEELWTGAESSANPVGVPSAYGGGTHVNDYLANPATCSRAGTTPIKLAEAVAALDGLGWRATGGATVPVIHLPAEVLAQTPNLERRGSQWRTRSGALVIADAGYPGTGPGGAAGTWGYVTGPVGVWLSEVSSDISTPETVTIELNRRIVWASRAFMVGFDPSCHIAVQIDYTLPTLTAPEG